MKKFLYIFWQCVWGAPQTLLGLVLFVLHWRCRHYVYHGAVVTHWRAAGGVSLGLFIFIHAQDDTPVRPALPAAGAAPRPGPAPAVRPMTLLALPPEGRLLLHEYGHTIQSLLLGPLYLACVGLPSFMWARLPGFKRLRRKKALSYYAVWPEKAADRLGAAAVRRWTAAAPQNPPQEG